MVLATTGVGKQGAGNGLLNNLIAYWPGNEASGNALDLHTNALHLTDVNTVTSNPGLVYATARQYTAANSERHVRPGDDALLSGGPLDFTLAAWFNWDGIAPSWSVASKYTTVISADYALIYGWPTANRLSWSVRNESNTALRQVIANTAGALTPGTWYLALAWCDRLNGQLGIQVNNGTPDTASFADLGFDNAATFRIGTIGSTYYMDGRIGPTAFWKSAPGGGGVLDATKRALLYNGGLGLAYSAFST